MEFDYEAMEFDYIECGNCLDLMKELPEGCIDLTVTSPPYDNLRDYKGYSFDFEPIAREFYRITKPGGVVVWVVGDATIKGSETGTSFKQALYFKEIGFNLHDTMIWSKDTLSFPDAIRYGQSFEYMFVFSKGRPKAIHKIADRKNKWAGTMIHGTSRNPNGETFRKGNHKKNAVKEYGERFNIWNMPTEKANKTGHPAVFPLQLAKDHILSWSNEGEIVLDPFLGSGTTALAAIETNRHYIGFEISKEYFEIALKRLENNAMILENNCGK
jgi:site-specific DNA-methyltransferase (adenine-specific)